LIIAKYSILVSHISPVYFLSDDLPGSWNSRSPQIMLQWTSLYIFSTNLDSYSWRMHTQELNSCATEYAYTLFG
jgi:hypothetical protein